MAEKKKRFISQRMNRIELSTLELHYLDLAFSQGRSSIDSSHMTQSPKHLRQVIMP